MISKTMLHIGFSNVLMTSRVVAIISPESAPVKRLVSDGRDKGDVVDATHGRRTRSVVLTDVGKIFLSSLQPETLAGRLDPNWGSKEEDPSEAGEKADCEEK